MIANSNSHNLWKSISLASRIDWAKFSRYSWLGTEALIFSLLLKFGRFLGYCFWPLCATSSPPLSLSALLKRRAFIFLAGTKCAILLVITLRSARMTNEISREQFFAEV